MLANGLSSLGILSAHHFRANHRVGRYDRRFERFAVHFEQPKRDIIGRHYPVATEPKHKASAQQQLMWTGLSVHCRHKTKRRRLAKLLSNAKRKLNLKKVDAAIAQLRPSKMRTSIVCPLAPFSSPPLCCPMQLHSHILGLTPPALRVGCGCVESRRIISLSVEIKYPKPSLRWPLYVCSLPARTLVPILGHRAC